MGSDGQALAEFDATYPFLVFAADYGIRRFFRYDASLIDEALAETMARTFERWEQVRRHGNPIAWVAECAMHVCLEQLRANESPESVAISRSLDRLSSREREVAVLRFGMDCDEATTAAALGTTVAEVRSAARDGRRQLGELLSGVYVETDKVAR